MDSIDITYFGRTVAFPDLPRYRKFYARLKAGAWELLVIGPIAAVAWYVATGRRGKG